MKHNGYDAFTRHHHTRAGTQDMFKNRKLNIYYGQCIPVIFMEGGGEGGRMGESRSSLMWCNKITKQQRQRRSRDVAFISFVALAQ